jgi:uncharacterized protein YggE
VKGVKSIQVGETQLPPPVPVFNANEIAPGAGTAPTPTPIISGQQEISEQVRVSYLLG